VKYKSISQTVDIILIGMISIDKNRSEN